MCCAHGGCRQWLMNDDITDHSLRDSTLGTPPTDRDEHPTTLLQTSMSAYYSSHSPRPQPQVSIPSFPEPQQPYQQRQTYPADPSSSAPDWVQYAEAANAQVDQHGNYSTGYGGYEYDEYGGGYGDETPSAPRNGSNGFLAPNPYSPTSSGSSYYPNSSPFDQAGPSYQRSDGFYDPNEYRPDLSSMHRTQSYPDEYLTPSRSSYDPGGASFSFPEPTLLRSTSAQGHSNSIKRQHRPVHSDVGSAVSLQRQASHASYAPSLQANVSAFVLFFHTPVLIAFRTLLMS